MAPFSKLFHTLHGTTSQIHELQSLLCKCTKRTSLLSKMGSLTKSIGTSVEALSVMYKSYRVGLTAGLYDGKVCTILEIRGKDLKPSQTHAFCPTYS